MPAKQSPPTRSFKRELGYPSSFSPKLPGCSRAIQPAPQRSGYGYRDAPLTLQDSDVVAAALTLFRSEPVLGFSDCLILQLARKAGHLPLGTFDRNIGKIDGAQKL
jgi:hypothetical protein